MGVPVQVRQYRYTGMVSRGLSQYKGQHRNSHYKDETVSWLSYLYNIYIVTGPLISIMEFSLLNRQQIYMFWNRPLESGGPSPWALWHHNSNKYIVNHIKSEVSVMHILHVWVQNFVWNFKGALWNFTQNLELIHCKICISWGAKSLTSYDILELWHLKYLWDKPHKNDKLVLIHSRP